MRSFLANIELWLTALGLVVVLTVPAALADLLPFWPTMAVTAAGVGVIHGLIFWMVRRRQRTVRGEAITDIREMLSDRVNNHLTLVLLDLEDGTIGIDPDRLRGIQATLGEVTALVGSLSEETLRGWRARYQGAMTALERGLTNGAA